LAVILAIYKMSASFPIPNCADALSVLLQENREDLICGRHSSSVTSVNFLTNIFQGVYDVLDATVLVVAHKTMQYIYGGIGTLKVNRTSCLGFLRGISDSYDVLSYFPLAASGIECMDSTVDTAAFFKELEPSKLADLGAGLARFLKHTTIELGAANICKSCQDFDFLDLNGIETSDGHALRLAAILRGMSVVPNSILEDWYKRATESEENADLLRFIAFVVWGKIIYCDGSKDGYPPKEIVEGLLFKANSEKKSARRLTTEAAEEFSSQDILFQCIKDLDTSVGISLKPADDAATNSAATKLLNNAPDIFDCLVKFLSKEKGGNSKTAGMALRSLAFNNIPGGDDISRLPTSAIKLMGPENGDVRKRIYQEGSGEQIGAVPDEITNCLVPSGYRSIEGNVPEYESKEFKKRTRDIKPVSVSTIPTTRGKRNKCTNWTGVHTCAALISYGTAEQLSAMTKAQWETACSHAFIVAAQERNIKVGNLSKEEKTAIIVKQLRTIGSEIGEDDADDTIGSGLEEHISPNFVKVVRNLEPKSDACAYLAKYIPNDFFQFATKGQAVADNASFPSPLLGSCLTVMQSDQISSISPNDPETENDGLPESYVAEKTARDLLFSKVLFDGNESQRAALSGEQLVHALNVTYKLDGDDNFSRAGFTANPPCAEVMSRVRNDEIEKLWSFLGGENAEGNESASPVLDESVKAACLQHIFFTQDEDDRQLGGARLFTVLHRIACSKASLEAKVDGGNEDARELKKNDDQFSFSQTAAMFVGRLSADEAEALGKEIINRFGAGDSTQLIDDILFGGADCKSPFHCALAPRAKVKIKSAQGKHITEDINIYPLLVHLNQKSGNAISQLFPYVAEKYNNTSINKVTVTRALKISAKMVSFELKELFGSEEDENDSPSRLCRMIDAVMRPDNSDYSLAASRFILLLQIIFFGFLFTAVRVNFYIAFFILSKSEQESASILASALVSSKSLDELSKVVILEA
jgi:hypothetical protein